MLQALIWSAGGLGLLIIGAETLVRGGSALAARLRISPLVVGLTIVAVGTSAPELAIGVEAAVQGNGSLAVGNIAGTNCVNILLILGLSAAMRPLPLRLQTLRLELPVIVGASVLKAVMVADGVLSRLDGAVLVSLGLLFTIGIVRASRDESFTVRKEFAAEYGGRSKDRHGMLREVTQLVGGIAVVVLGADWLVDGAVDLARLWGVSDAFIGLTIVAIGTSAPELVTTVVSTMRDQRDIAIGNLIGSSAYNILIILGVTSLVPAGGIGVAEALIWVDVPVMVAVALACVPVFLTGRIVSRAEGVGFVLAYLAYLSFLLAERT
ncbi:calcium/sodium antiporter [Sphingomonas lenta]|uniref:Sodium:calcium antiporter n=1 Tax=Sphingomonas lenta TaxID=1141887 RepID=A0A2A2SI01_9SPHN|nr:calcium/sodium antiporter [Sphingomonas lenta]PAX08853.1 sodium:calcium antiporter [Sphingomonas lenta]